MDLEQARELLEKLPPEVLAVLRQPPERNDERLKDLYYYRDAYVNQLKQVVSDNKMTELTDAEIQRLQATIDKAQRRIDEILHRRNNFAECVQEIKDQIVHYDKQIQLLNAQRAASSDLRRLIRVVDVLDGRVTE